MIFNNYKQFSKIKVTTGKLEDTMIFLDWMPKY